MLTATHAHNGYLSLYNSDNISFAELYYTVHLLSFDCNTDNIKFVYLDIYCFTPFFSFRNVISPDTEITINLQQLFSFTFQGQSTLKHLFYKIIVDSKYNFLILY